MKKIEETFSVDFDVYALVTSSLNLCTYHDLQTRYSTQDAYDLLEIMEVNRELHEIADQRAKQQENMNG